ncbi:hypothetical protein AAHA92_00057 [Salvia divinorum]|uniref:Uncharacterized protein n=1 Tax=Salvia divinorum TaxID=28513 RepID=A0ABD1IJE9_SALDI
MILCLSHGLSHSPIWVDRDRQFYPGRVEVPDSLTLCRSHPSGWLVVADCTRVGYKSLTLLCFINLNRPGGYAVASCTRTGGVFSVREVNPIANPPIISVKC